MNGSGQTPYRELMAQQLMQQGMQSRPITSPWQSANQIASALLGARMMKNYRTDQAAKMKAISEALTGKPAVVPFSQETPGPRLAEPAVAPNRNKAYSLMMGSDNPALQQIGLTGMLEKPEQTKWGITEVGAPDGKTQRMAYNVANPSEMRPMGSPYTKKPLVSISKGNEEYQKLEAKRLDKLVSSADDSSDLINTADQFMSFANDVQTGTFAPAKYQAAAWVEGLGLDPKQVFGLNVGAAQAMGAVGNQLALKLRKEMPGQLSNQDVQFLVNANLGIKKTPEANALLSEAIKAVANRKIEKSQQAQDWYDRHNSSMRGFDRHWSKYIKANPLFANRKKPQPLPGTAAPNIDDLLKKY